MRRLKAQLVGMVSGKSKNVIMGGSMKALPHTAETAEAAPAELALGDGRVVELAPQSPRAPASPRGDDGAPRANGSSRTKAWQQGSSPAGCTLRAGWRGRVATGSLNFERRQNNSSQSIQNEEGLRSGLGLTPYFRGKAYGFKVK